MSTVQEVEPRRSGQRSVRFCITDTELLGVDGCRKGWFYFQLDGAKVEYGIAKDIRSLLARCRDAGRILIDIPIGLLDSKPCFRACDVAARRALSPKRSVSVFPVPSRAACHATSYESACALNVEVLGRSLSRQTWGITPKIREVDMFLQESADMHERLFEAHPEVVFWAFNNKRPMERSKKNPWGFLDRVELLEHYYPGARELIRTASDSWLPAVVPDDVCDALALAMAATCESLATLPDEPPLDAHGLPMRMVYPVVSQRS